MQRKNNNVSFYGQVVDNSDAILWMCAAMVSANTYKCQRGSHRRGVCTRKW